MSRHTLTLPRWGTRRQPKYPTNGELAAHHAAAMGEELFAWQAHVFDVALEYDPATGIYRRRNVGVEVGRQNGKTFGAAVRVAMEIAEPDRHVGFTAQDRNMAREKWEEHIEMLKDHDELVFDPKRDVTLSNGRERLDLPNGSSYSIFTPSRKGARGKTLDLVMIDEALTHTKEVLDAVGPTMLTRPNAQLWLLSNAGDDSSELLKHFRDLGHKDNPDETGLAWFEWAPQADRFDIDDEDVWYEAIPTLAEEDRGVTIEGVRSLRQSMQPDDFAREVLNVWPSSSAIAVIDPDDWERLEDPEIIAGDHGLVFGVAISPDREWATIAVAGDARGGRCVVEVVEHAPRTAWLPERLQELARRHRASVVLDGGGPAGTLIEPLEQARVKTTILGTRDYARSCATFYDLVTEGVVAHRGQWPLDDAVKGATKRALGDGWAWNRRGEVVITPLEAVSIAATAQRSTRPKPRKMVL